MRDLFQDLFDIVDAIGRVDFGVQFLDLNDPLGILETALPFFAYLLDAVDIHHRPDRLFTLKAATGLKLPHM
ncbi:MAG: hypothetical protein AAGL24_20515 [Pseudomonadota bacterium]